MGFDYQPGSGVPKDQVRFLIGDTDSNAVIELRLEDEEIEGALALFGGLFAAAAACADALAAKFARQPEGSAGPHTIRPSSRAQELRATATRLRGQAALGAAPSAGGLGRPLTFVPGQFDHPEPR